MCFYFKYKIMSLTIKLVQAIENAINLSITDQALVQADSLDLRGDRAIGQLGVDQHARKALEIAVLLLLLILGLDSVRISRHLIPNTIPVEPNSILN